MAAFSATLNSISYFNRALKIEVKAANKWRPSCAMTPQDSSKSLNSGRSRRQVWRRRKLAKKDELADYAERVPFLEERVRMLRETGEIISKDIERMLLSEDNRFAFVNDVVEDAHLYASRNEYGGAKKAIRHVLSDRMNDYGFYRPDAYVEDVPYKPGPGYLREKLKDKN